MKKRPRGFIAEDKIDHDGEIFDYIKELQEYLWRVVRVAHPGAGGGLCECIDPALEKLELKRAEKQKEPPKNIYLHYYDDAVENGISIKKIDDDDIKYIRADCIEEYFAEQEKALRYAIKQIDSG